jgi:hypothetical protein
VILQNYHFKIVTQSFKLIGILVNVEFSQNNQDFHSQRSEESRFQVTIGFLTKLPIE